MFTMGCHQRGITIATERGWPAVRHVFSGLLRDGTEFINETGWAN